jgi:hypothetical protein
MQNNESISEQFSNVDLIILRGWPGSGKTTLAKTKFPDRTHLEADMFFIEANGKYKWDGRKIRQAHEWCQNAFVTALKNRAKVIVSNTFVKIQDMLFYTDYCRNNGLTFRIIECKGDFENVHDVPEDKVKAMKEGFQELPENLKPYLVKLDVEIDPKLLKAKDHYTKPIPLWSDKKIPCVIIDMDGTLALFDKKDRSPYEDWKLENDKININLRFVLRAIKEHGPDTQLFICSGRDAGRSFEPTKKWLLNHGVYFDDIFMRKAGDQRADDIVKEEIYREKIEPNYQVIAVFDDRLSVCRLWWRLGLPLFRLGDPDANF